MSPTIKDSVRSRDQELLAKSRSASLPPHELLTTTHAGNSDRLQLPGLSEARGFKARGGGAGGATAETGFLELLSQGLSIINSNRILVVSVFIFTVLGTYLYTSSLPKIYAANATLQIDPKPPTPLGRGVESVVELGSGNFWNTVEYYNTQHALLASQPVSLNVAKELGLANDRRFFLNLADDEPITPLSADARPPTAESAAGVIRSRLSVVPKKNTRLVTLTYEDSSPQRAERILNALLRSYVAYNLNRVLDSTSSAVEWLGEQLDGLRTQLSSSELALHQYKLDKQIASLGIDDQTSMLKQEMGQLSQRRTQVRVRIEEVRAGLSQLNSVDASQPTTVPQLNAFKGSELPSLRNAYLIAQQEYSELIAGGKGAQHPAVKGVKASVAEIKSSLSREIENIRSGAEKELVALKAQEAGLSKLLSNAEKQALDLNLMEIEYSRLKRTKDNNEKLYSMLLERSKEAGLTQMLKFNNIHILSQPSASSTPVRPRLLISLSVGCLAGLIFGFLAAFGRQQLDRSVQSLVDMEALVGLPAIGSIPSSHASESSVANSPAAKREARKTNQNRLEFSVLEQPHSSYTEAIRTLRTNLLFMSPDSPHRSLLVTSPGASEGKTTMACALAMSFAQAGKKVVLIDCDLRRARIHNVLSPKGGSSQSLAGNLLLPSGYNPEELLTEVPNLSVMQAGPTPPNPAELLQSKKFHSLLHQLEDDFDLVVLDSSPLIVTDAAIIGSLVDGVLLVVRALKTDRRQLTRSLQTLQQVGAPFLGAVLNGNDQQIKGYGYSGYYGTPRTKDEQA